MREKSVEGKQKQKLAAACLLRQNAVYFVELSVSVKAWRVKWRDLCDDRAAEEIEKVSFLLRESEKSWVIGMITLSVLKVWTR